MLVFQGYVACVEGAIARVPATLQAVVEMSAGESFAARLQRFEEDSKRALANYRSLLMLTRYE